MIQRVNRAVGADVVRVGHVRAGHVRAGVAIGVLVMAGVASAQPAVIGPWPSAPYATGNTNYYGPSIYPYPVPIGYGTLGPVGPDGVTPATYSWPVAFNGASYDAAITAHYTYTTTPTVTTIAGWLRLSSTISNTTSILTTIDSSGNFSVPIDLLQSATMTSTFWTPGDPMLATGTYLGFGVAAAGPAGPAAVVPGFSTSASYAPGQYSIGCFIASHFEVGTGDWATQNVEMHFSLVIEAVPAPGAAALLGIAGLWGARRRR